MLYHIGSQQETEAHLGKQMGDFNKGLSVGRIQTPKRKHAALQGCDEEEWSPLRK